jgi:hypothetical protein
MKLTDVEENKIFIGLMFFVYILAGESVFKKSRDRIKDIQDYPVLRYSVIFGAAFIASKDIIVSAILTLVYIVMFDVLLDPTHRYTIVRK